HDAMTFPEQRIDERRRGGEDGAVLLVCVGRRDEEAAAQLVARHMRRAEPPAEESRTVRLADPGKTHDHDECRTAMRRRRYGRDLRAELWRENLRTQRVRVRLRRGRDA